MERSLDYKEYLFYRNLRRPIGGNNILKNEEEYNEYWKKIDWIQDWIKTENNHRIKKYHKTQKQKKYGRLIKALAFILIISIIGAIFNFSWNYYLYMIAPTVAGIWAIYHSVEDLKPPKKATIFDLLNNIKFSETTPLSLALIIEKYYRETEVAYANKFLLTGRHNIGFNWRGLDERALYMLMADALILDKCLKSMRHCKCNCSRCKAKEYRVYNDDDFYYYNRFYWRVIYRLPPADILLIYNGQVGRKNIQPLPENIEKRYWGSYGVNWKRELNRWELTKDFYYL